MLGSMIQNDDLEWMRKNEIKYKEWVAAGDNSCNDCIINQQAGKIPINDNFPSGIFSYPAHPDCECYINPVQIDLRSIPDSELWEQ